MFCRTRVSRDTCAQLVLDSFIPFLKMFQNGFVNFLNNVTHKHFYPCPSCVVMAGADFSPTPQCNLANQARPNGTDDRTVCPTIPVTHENDGTDERTEYPDDDDGTNSERTPMVNESNFDNLGVHHRGRFVVELAPLDFWYRGCPGGGFWYQGGPGGGFWYWGWLGGGFWYQGWPGQ